MKFPIKRKSKKIRRGMATRITFDLIVDNQKMLNFDTRKSAEKWLEWARENKHFMFEKGEPKIDIKPRFSKTYQLGEMWRDDFDYEGMIKAGKEARIEWGVEKLQKLFDSYEDVNYHAPNEPLYGAINYLKMGADKSAERELSRFRRINKKILDTKFKWYPKR
jgi:hypothetical protein